MTTPLLDTAHLSRTDLHTLAAFRSTAADVHRIYGPYHAASTTVRVLRAGKPDEADLLPRDILRSLGIAVRQAYMAKEPGSFERAAALLARVRDPEVSGHLARIKDDWRRTLTGWLHVHIGEDRFSPQRLLDTWLYALTVHRDEGKQWAANRLREVGPLADWGLELTVRGLSIAIVNLDSLLAVAVDDSPLPRLGKVDNLQEDSHFG